MSQMPTQPPLTDKSQQDTRYLIVVAGLMILIMVTLAFLWITERNRRQRAEERLAEANAALTSAHEQVQAMQLIAGLGAQSGVRPANRDDLPRQTMIVNGKDCSVLLIGPGAGERFGFLPGDVICVTGQAATAPTETPSTSPSGK